MLSAGPRRWLAGHPGPPPSRATVVLILVVLALGLAAAVIAQVPGGPARGLTSAGAHPIGPTPPP